jgi:hypothetical protein
VEPCPDGTGVDARGSGVEEKEAGTETTAKPVDEEARRASDQAVVAEGAVGQGGERDGGANVTELLMRTAGRAHLLKPLEAAVRKHLNTHFVIFYTLSLPPLRSIHCIVDFILCVGASIQFLVWPLDVGDVPSMTCRRLMPPPLTRGPACRRSPTRKA